MDYDYQEIVWSKDDRLSQISVPKEAEEKRKELRCEIILWSMSFIISIGFSFFVILKHSGWSVLNAFGEVSYLLVCATLILTPCCRVMLNLDKTDSPSYVFVGVGISMICVVAYVWLYDLSPSVLSVIVTWIIIAATIGYSSFLYVKSAKGLAK